MVLDLIMDKGEHHIGIELLDSADQIFESRALQTAVENKDNYIASLNLYYGGNLPAGGVFFKLYDIF